MDVKRRQERERVRFVLQEMGDSDYSEYDSDGNNHGLAARRAREAVFMESREAREASFALAWATLVRGMESREEVVAVSPLVKWGPAGPQMVKWGPAEEAEDRRQRHMGSDDSDSDYDSPRVFHGR